MVSRAAVYLRTHEVRTTELLEHVRLVRHRVVKDFQAASSLVNDAIQLIVQDHLRELLFNRVLYVTLASRLNNHKPLIDQ